MGHQINQHRKYGEDAIISFAPIASFARYFWNKFEITSYFWEMNNEITFIVRESEEGGYTAESAGVAIFAEGETIFELKENIKSGIECYFESSSKIPTFVHLHFVKDEVFAI